jgi:undecaprenyl-diphosphatase
LTLLQAIILGIVQGITEYLPISSSGHLVLAQHLFGLREPELMFDVAVHVGTLGAVVVFFRQDLINMLRAVVRFGGQLFKGQAAWRDLWQNPDLRLTSLVVIGTIPTVILGLFFKPMTDRLFGSTALVGAMLLITGLLLWSTRWIKRPGHGIGETGGGQAVLIGLVQGLAILPGISRSGATIAAGLWSGLDRATATRFSFILSLPAIVGATLLVAADAVGTPQATVSLPVMAAGMLAAGVVGYLALRFLVYMVQRSRLFVFAPYCWLVGMVTLLSG